MGVAGENYEMVAGMAGVQEGRSAKCENSLQEGRSVKCENSLQSLFMLIGIVA